MDISARRPPAAVSETTMDGGNPVEGETHMADVAAGAAWRAERSTSPAVGMSGAAQAAASVASVAGETPHSGPSQAVSAPESAAIQDGRTLDAPATTVNGAAESSISQGCTQAQLRRFIKSRPYVPMHELRRRFELNGAADEVSAIRVADGTVYVGLGARESDFIAELVRQGDVGVELCHDPPVPMVVGVYAMRPISR
jgi:hypothetical protein